jgi:hypothetical protein
MFYCEECRRKRDWPQAFTTSFGKCECCGLTNICYELPSSLLPEPKEPNPSVNMVHKKVKLPHPYMITSHRSLGKEVRMKLYSEEQVCNLLESLGLLVEKQA